MKNESRSNELGIVYPDVPLGKATNGNILTYGEPTGQRWHGVLLNDFFSSCLVDYSGKQFSCVHDRCKEHNLCSNENLLADKFNFHELHSHDEDRKLWCDKVFPDILRFIDSEPDVETSDYRFIFNHRYLRKDGSISQFMHEGSITFIDDKCLPVLNLKVFFEIADIKADETIVLTIFRYMPDHGYRKVLTRMYSTTNNSLLTLRELEIIKLCHEGLSCKMIAEKLKLSIHTVKNHKRNCMEKTRTHNISELIHHCIHNHWL
jgi:DNA-binding CsgD family transcriptional regulator